MIRFFIIIIYLAALAITTRAQVFKDKKVVSMPDTIKGPANDYEEWLRNEPIYSVESTQTIEYSTIPALSYDILMVCANWPGTRAEAWKTLLKARAIENLSYVVGVNRVGTDGADIAYSGDSLVSDFKGLPIAECIPGEEQIVLAKLSASALDTFRHHWPFHLDFD
jgi:predicted amidohydrolase